MAKEEVGQKSGKRRLRAPAETVRQRQTNLASRSDQPKRSVIRPIGRLLGWPFRTIAAFKLWQTTAWKPFKFIGRWIGLIVWPPYFRNSFRELKLVTWPNWKQSWRLTFAVLSFAAVFGVVIAGLDWGLDRLFKDILLK